MVTLVGGGTYAGAHVALALPQEGGTRERRPQADGDDLGRVGTRRAEVGASARRHRTRRRSRQHPTTRPSRPPNGSSDEDIHDTHSDPDDGRPGQPPVARGSRLGPTSGQEGASHRRDVLRQPELADRGRRGDSSRPSDGVDERYRPERRERERGARLARALRRHLHAGEERALAASSPSSPSRASA